MSSTSGLPKVEPYKPIHEPLPLLQPLQRAVGRTPYQKRPYEPISNPDHVVNSIDKIRDQLQNSQIFDPNPTILTVDLNPAQRQEHHHAALSPEHEKLRQSRVAEPLPDSRVVNLNHRTQRHH